jgi:hypothetical protein
MMKLTPPGIEQTLSQVPCQVLPEGHPAAAELSRVFGDHTFFLDSSGLNIVEPTGQPVDGGTQTAQIVRLASWSDPGRSSLAPHEPEPTEILVMLDVAA